MGRLYLTKVGLTCYLVRYNAREDQWSRSRLEEFLRLHGYSEDDVDSILAQADNASEVEIYVPDERLQ